jgi:hypothetical protein
MVAGSWVLIGVKVGRPASKDVLMREVKGQGGQGCHVEQYLAVVFER